MSREDRLEDRAERLRRDFDASFARPLEVRERTVTEFLVIRLAGSTWAIARSEVSAVYADLTITHVPGAPPELLGVALQRDRAFPVYDLGTLLGRPTEHPRWVALAAVPVPVAFAFDGLDDHVACAQADITTTATGGLAHVERLVRLGAATLPIASLTSVVAMLLARGVASSKKESI